MAITEVAYCTREDVQRALNIADIPRLNARVDAAIQAGARDVEGALHRKFYPNTATYLFDQPDADILWLDELELAAAPTALLSGGEAMTLNTDFFLRPKSGPPYRWIEASYSGDVFWQSANTPQAAISVSGDFGYPCRVTAVTTIGSTISSSATSMSLSDSSQAGVGSLVLLDSERMIITDKTWSTTAATITADLGGNKNNTTLAVSSGALLNQGEAILIDGERMFIETIAGNSVTVDRAVNASTLAAHTTGATIYAPRTALLARAQCGTTAASHSSSAAVSLIQAPSLVRELNLALAINNTEQSLSAYARPVGSQDSQRDQTGRGVDAVLADAVQAYGRKNRTRAI